MSEVKLRMTRLEWALMMQESHGRRQAGRVDAHWRARLAAQGVKGDELEFQCRSWGLWGILGASLRELGFAGTGAEFRDNLALQLDFMRRKWARDTDPRDPEWWNIEHWNLDLKGDPLRRSPSSYYQGVAGWLRGSAFREEEMEIFFAVAA